jgi:bifunctional non-homologous end joining protein LigD
VRFVAFDLCWWDGADLRGRPLSERRARLEAVGGVEVTPSVGERGRAFYDEVVALGFEGVVGKRLDSLYRPGARSQAWRKVKAVHLEQVVVVGFTPGTGARSATLGSLVMAQWAGNGLVHVGEVGTGFDDATLAALRQALDQIAAPHPPVADPPRLPGVTWVMPGVVVRVEHRGWTRDGRLRAPSFKGVLPGVDPEQARRDSFSA